MNTETLVISQRWSHKPTFKVWGEWVKVEIIALNPPNCVEVGLSWAELGNNIGVSYNGKMFHSNSLPSLLLRVLIVVLM